jgi:hypothetical protein
MDAQELLKTCEEKIRWMDWKILLDSYRSEFAEIRCKVFADISIEDDEIECFIEICDNRIEHAKTYLGQVTTILSILIGSFLIFVSILMRDLIEAGSLDQPFREAFYSVSGLIQIFVVFVLLIVVVFILLLGHYRTEAHAWYAFKEGALLVKNGMEKEHKDAH